MSDLALPARPVTPDTLGLVADALRASGVSGLEQAAKARQDAVTVATAERWPELSLFANVSQQSYPADTFPSRGDWMRDKNAGVSLSWSVFDGFQTKGEVKEARANAARAEYELARAREQVRRAVMEGLLELERATADLQARSRTVQMAKRALDLANLRFEEGASSLLEVSDARIAWQVAQLHEARARRDYFAALALLERTTGRPLFAAATIPEVDP
jgi:outer membrane protein TolC